MERTGIGTESTDTGAVLYRLNTGPHYGTVQHKMSGTVKGPERFWPRRNETVRTENKNRRWLVLTSTSNTL